MATSLWTAWDDYVLPEVPGVLQAYARHHVKLAAIDFCKRAWVWVVDQGPITVAAKVNAYDWEPPVNTEITRPLLVWYEKEELSPRTRNDLSALYGDFMQAAGNPEAFAQDNLTQLILVPTPQAVSLAGITAKVALKPTRAATGIDSMIFNRYADDIALGAKARLLAVRKKPWSDPVGAEQYRQDYEAAVVAARLEVSKGLAAARLRTGGSRNARSRFF